MTSPNGEAQTTTAKRFSSTRSSRPIDGIFSVNLTNKLAALTTTTGYINRFDLRKPPIGHDRARFRQFNESLLLGCIRDKRSTEAIQQHRETVYVDWVGRRNEDQPAPVCGTSPPSDQLEAAHARPYRHRQLPDHSLAGAISFTSMSNFDDQYR